MTYVVQKDCSALVVMFKLNVIFNTLHHESWIQRLVSHSEDHIRATRQFAFPRRLRSQRQARFQCWSRHPWRSEQPILVQSDSFVPELIRLPRGSKEDRGTVRIGAVFFSALCFARAQRGRPRPTQIASTVSSCHVVARMQEDAHLRTKSPC